MKFKYNLKVDPLEPSIFFIGTRHRLNRRQEQEIDTLVKQLKDPTYQNKFLDIPEYVDVFQKRKDGEVYYEIQIYN